MTNDLDKGKWDLVRRYLGDALTEFVLATDTDASAEFLSPKQHEAAELLNRAFSASELVAWNDNLRAQDVAVRLCTFDPEFGMSLATYLHFFCGGQAVAPVTEQDDVEDVLCRLALDAYPLFLVERSTHARQFGAVSGLWLHPLHTAAVCAIYRPGEPLMRIFPAADFTVDPSGLGFDLNSSMAWSNGAGGSISLAGIPLAILLRSSGALRQDTSPLGSYVASVRQTLAAARTLAESKSATIPAIVGCYSLTFEDDLLEVQLSGARFRRKTAIDRVQIAELPHEEIILEVDVQLQATHLGLEGQTWMRPTADVEKWREAFQDRVSRARLAILLSSGEDEVLAVGQSFVCEPIPISLNTSWEQSPLAWPDAPLRGRALGVADVKAVQYWDKKLAGIPDGMRIGVQRLLSAVSERFSPYDGFIDAVITWENLFGGATDTTVRVAASLAWVLYPDDAEGRTAFFLETSKTYAARSALVHGSDAKKITYARAVELRDQSVHTAIRAIRTVLESGELRGAKNSIERSKLALMGKLA